MYVYDPKERVMQKDQEQLFLRKKCIKDTYVKIGRQQRGILYEPMELAERKPIAIIFIHSDEDYSTRPAGRELAARGYTVFCGAVSDRMGTLDKKLLDIKYVIEFLRQYPGVQKIVLMGHSGGATLMSAYQAAAENGISLWKGEHMLISCSLEEELPEADGIMLIDSNWGNGAMTLFSIDPAVMEEGNGRFLDPNYDIFCEENGYSPSGAHYTEKFKRDYFAAQRERNNRLISQALERLWAIQKGRGHFLEDEPLLIAGGVQTAPANKLFPQDISLFSHTKEKYDLIHRDGEITVETVRSLRRPKAGKNMTYFLKDGALFTTVKSFLTGKAVPADKTYAILEDGAVGICWDACYSCTPGNVKHIHVPMLCMGMTAGYEYLASEEIYRNSSSHDKTIAFVEGAGHNFDTEKEVEAWPGQFGDTAQLLYDYIDEWLSKKGCL